MDGKNDVDKIDDVMLLPGFRFHPTDEELVGFYLKRKIQQRPLPIELIKQVDIYKYDPWDLPNLAPTGEKEWYFYCPRDRKYRNSARPNRVTGAGFWKATGTDRPIYSSNATKCIGLKKSLVFYRGRAAKGIKTDWMMHEFRLPSISDPTPPKKLLDKNIPANDSWAICRIFKKTSSMAQRALSHSWVSPLPETTLSDMFTQGTQTGTESAIQLCNNSDLKQQASSDGYSALDIPSHRVINPTVYKPSPFAFPNENLPNNFMFSPDLIENVNKAADSIDFGGSQHQFNSFSIGSPLDLQGRIGIGEDDSDLRKNLNSTRVNNQWGNVREFGFPFSLSDTWKPNLPWDSPPCPSEMSTTYSNNKCYT